MALYSDINIDQGSSFSSTINVKDANGLPFDLDGYSARGQIRKSYASLTAINFSTVVLAPTTLGQVGVSLTSAVTKTLKAGRYVFDVEIYNISNDVIRIAEGQVNVSPSVTRPYSTVSSLSDLELNFGQINPGFDTDIHNYNVSIPTSVPTITVLPTLTYISSTIKVNGISADSGAYTDPIVLNAGTNTITIVVTAQDGITTSSYTITATHP